MANTEKKSSAIWWVVGLIVVVGLGYFIFRESPAPAPSTNAPVATTMTPPAVNSTGEVKTPELQGTITLGAVLPLTGNSSALGLSVQKTIELAVGEINAAGGVNGKKLQVQSEDGQCDGKAAATAIEKLVTTAQVQVILGGQCPEEIIGMAPVLNAKKVVGIYASDISSDIDLKSGGYVFRFAPSDASAGSAAAVFAAKNMSATRAAVISENSDATQGLRTMFTTAFTAAGGGIVIDETFSASTTNFRAQALKVKNGNVGAVYVVSKSPASAIAIIKALRDQKVTAKILTSEVLLGSDVAKNNADVLEGVMGFDPAFDQTTTPVTTFIAAYKAKYGEDLVSPSIQESVYSEVYLLKEVITRAGEYNGEKIQQEFAKTTNWSGGASSGVSFDKNGSLDWKSYNVKQILGGKVSVLKVMTLE